MTADALTALDAAGGLAKLVEMMGRLLPAAEWATAEVSHDRWDDAVWQAAALLAELDDIAALDGKEAK